MTPKKLVRLLTAEQLEVAKALAAERGVTVEEIAVEAVRAGIKGLTDACKNGVPLAALVRDPRNLN